MIELIDSDLSFVESYNNALKKVSQEREFLSTQTGFTLEESTNFLKFVLGKKFPQVFLVENDEVCGWADICPRAFPDFSHVGILGMGIVKKHRGKGLGELLLTKIIEKAREFGFQKVELSVYESNQSAIQLYEKFGFFHEGKRLKSRKLGEKFYNEVLMGLFL